MRRMRWFKIAAIAGGIIIAFLVVGSVIGFIIHAVMDLVIAALVVGAIVVAIKMARSGRQISRKRAEREVRDRDTYQPLPRNDVEPYSGATRQTQQPRPQQQAQQQSAPSSHDIDDELARLKREMGS
jgi:hypothetical protein